MPTYPRKNTTPVDRKIPVPRVQDKKMYARLPDNIPNVNFESGRMRAGGYTWVEDGKGGFKKMSKKIYNQAITHPFNPLFGRKPE